jgi:FkbM family methyltransferase
MRGWATPAFGLNGRMALGNWIRSIEGSVRSSPALRRVLRPAWGLVRRALARSPRGVEVVVNGVDRFRLHPESLYLAEHEREEYLAFCAAIEPGTVVLDVGAHAGIYTLAAARRGARVVAFEPAPEPRARLESHLRWNDLQAEVEPLVVSDRDGPVTLYGAGVGRTSSLLRDAVHVGAAAPIRVEAVSVDSYCERRGIAPGVVKVDVEGAELAVLRGMARTLETARPVVFVELHPVWVAGLGDSVEELPSIAAGAGYGLERLRDGAFPDRGPYVLRPLDRARG